MQRSAGVFVAAAALLRVSPQQLIGGGERYTPTVKSKTNTDSREGGGTNISVLNPLQDKCEHVSPAVPADVRTASSQQREAGGDAPQPASDILNVFGRFLSESLGRFFGPND